MPVPARMIRDLGHAAVELAEKRGTGRRMRGYRAWLRATVRLSSPPRIAIIGAGDGVEVRAALLGIKSAAQVPKGAEKVVFVLSHDAEDMRKAIRVQECCKVRRCRVRNEMWPCHEAVDVLVARRGSVWFDQVIVAPTANAAWAVEALKVLTPLFDTDTLVVLCRAWEGPMQQVARALAGRGWGGVDLGEVAALQRRGGPAEP